MFQTHHLTDKTPKSIGTSALYIFLCLMGLLVMLSFQQADQPQDTLQQPPVLADTILPQVTPVTPDEEIFAERDFTRNDLRRGQRLFKGMIPFGSGTHDCSSCHYTTVSDTLNWNPSAYDLAMAWQENEQYSVKDRLDNLIGRRMIADHPGMTITAEEEHTINAYLQYVIQRGPGELHAFPANAFIFWGVGLLMLLALIDLIFTKKIRFKVLHVLVIIVGLMVHFQYAMAEAQSLGRTQGYTPDQPIKFSHRIHAGENEIDCNYCHNTSSFSASAGIPSNNTCMNCHNVIREGTNSGRFEITKIHRAVETGQPVKWIRVHKLPDHSKFNHAFHVNAGKLDCSECHGDVAQMHIVRQEEALSMGWCLSCHRDTHVDFVDNPYYHMYEQLHQEIRDGIRDGVTAAQLGGQDCYVCHH